MLRKSWVTCEWEQQDGTGCEGVTWWQSGVGSPANLHLTSFLHCVICGLRHLRRSLPPHRSPSEETANHQCICVGLLYGLLQLQQSLDDGEPDRQGTCLRPLWPWPEDQVGGRWTGLIPGILRSSLLLPEALSLDWWLCFYAGPGEENLESQPHRTFIAQRCPHGLLVGPACLVINRILSSALLQ